MHDTDEQIIAENLPIKTKRQITKANKAKTAAKAKNTNNSKDTKDRHQYYRDIIASILYKRHQTSGLNGVWGIPGRI